MDLQKLEIMKELRTVMVENLELEGVPERLQDSDRLYEDLNIDSIMVLQLVVYIEEVFHVVVPEVGVEPETFLTVGSLVEFIMSLHQAAV
ncbi:phosphopantetheine-binding protein [Paenibacillus sp. N3.4]|uniref:phosphopantetheine-binding protein n=1 Tax=Paenibacillus sp. N3.4 TaxID=2603222 RepID=UPI0021C3294F|nr:phosphopantetheine-binding protein [Paenibacillus sp. N3.4]